MTYAEGFEFDLRRQQLDLADVVAGAATTLRHRFEDQELQLLEALRPAVMMGDETRLRQVVTNMLTNALKFVPAEGTIRVSTATADGDAILTVCDDGPGIAEEDLPRVFDRFYRGRGVRTGGSGIGLAVVASLVRAHGGDVTVSNDPTGGACFRVRLPGSRTSAAVSRH